MIWFIDGFFHLYSVYSFHTSRIKDDEFDSQLAELNNIESSELITNTNKDQANLPNLPEIVENNEGLLDQISESELSEKEREAELEL